MNRIQICDVFREYQNYYEKILANLYPAKNSTGFPERNLSVNFVRAYEKVAEANGQECVSWFEMQFGERNNYHVDAVIWNVSTHELVIVEAKRFNNPSAKAKEIREDIDRIHKFVEELQTEDRLDMSGVKKCYGVILADVWTETDLKRSILHSYEIGQGDPHNENSFIKQYAPDLTLPNLQYDVRDIAAIKTYFLLSFLWELERWTRSA